jgi:hypothetical protein
MVPGGIIFVQANHSTGEGGKHGTDQTRGKKGD